MIDFSRSNVDVFAAHWVGNKGIGEELRLSNNPYDFTDDFTKETIFRYLVSNFKGDAYYQFKNRIDKLALINLYEMVQDVFAKRKTTMEFSQVIAMKLYDESMHPKIKSGELYTVYFRDLICDGELCDGIGIFKSESKDNFLKVQHDDAGAHIEVDLGNSIDKLDKGCIIFNTDAKNGYKALFVDNSQKIAENALYWKTDFLEMELKKSAYMHTSNYIETCIGFCGEVLSEANNVDRLNQMKYLNESVKYFKENNVFVQSVFEHEVLKDDKEVISSFREYQKETSKNMGLTLPEPEFDISGTAVKENQKYAKSVIKLDKNYQLIIMGRHEMIEKGYDEEKGLKFFKLYYVNEE